MCVVALTLAVNSITAYASVVAHWTFDELGGDTAHDNEGSFNGTLSPSGAAFVAGGISGNAISLTKASNGFVNMGNVLGLTNGDFSIVCWIKTSPGDTTAESIFLSKHAAGYVNGYLIMLNTASGNQGQTNKVNFYDSTFPGQEVISTTSVNDGTWHQIVSVYQAGGNALIYVDGTPAEASKASQPIVANTVAFLLGGANFSGVPTGLFTGLLDDVQIYNSALSEGEVDFLFQHPGQVFDSPQVSLIKAVKPSFSKLMPGVKYQLQTSIDMNTWYDQGLPFSATSTNMVSPWYYDVDSWNQLFFRLQVSP